MNTTDVRAVVLDALGRIAPEADPATIPTLVPIRDLLDLDSMDFLNFALALHQRLGIDIPEADYPQLASIDGAVAYLAARLEAAHGASGPTTVSSAEEKTQ